MREVEAKTIVSTLQPYETLELTPMLEIGSSTSHFRSVVKPHIEEQLHGPLRRRGIRMVTTDLKNAAGVDISGDIFELSTQEKMRAVSANALMCCNILEHVEDREAFADVCTTLLPQGGVLIVTVPRSFPYHPDPIDTRFRPLPEEIANLFPEFQLERSMVIIDCSYWEHLKKMGILYAFGFVLLRFLKNLIYIFRPRKLQKKMNWILWLWKKIEISFVVMRKV